MYARLRLDYSPSSSRAPLPPATSALRPKLPLDTHTGQAERLASVDIIWQGQQAANATSRWIQRTINRSSDASRYHVAMRVAERERPRYKSA